MWKTQWALCIGVTWRVPEIVKAKISRSPKELIRIIFFSSALSSKLRLHHGNLPFLLVEKRCFIFPGFPPWRLYQMTINFPFPLIKSNSPSDSVWHWYASGRVCNSAVLHAGWTLFFLQGWTQTSPMKPLGEKTPREGSLWVQVWHGLAGKHQEQDLSWMGAWGRTAAPRERGNPALSASSEQLALADNNSEAERQSTFPFTALPFPSRAGAHGELAVQPSGILPTCTFPTLGYYCASLFQPSSSRTEQLRSLSQRSG